MNTDDATHGVHWDGRKWRNRVHWQFETTWLGEDAFGTWLAVPAGTRVRRGREAAFRLEHTFVAVVPRDTWWSGEFYTSHPELEVYVNIGTPAEWSSGVVRQVDLDLDVIRGRDGSVRTLDEDEFIDHQARFRYPRELIDGARRAAGVVATMLERRIEPFDKAAQPWLECVARDAESRR